MKVKMHRIVFFGTHPKQFNGYSKVTYELVHQFAKRDDVEFILFGFQNFYKTNNHREDIPKNVEIYDANAHNSSNLGFGITEVASFVREKKPDICIIFNDAGVIRLVMNELLKIPKEERTFKIVPYLDQVYLNQRKDFVNFVNENADACILFTKYWENIYRSQGCTLPTYNLPHGFNPNSIPVIPRDKAREALGVDNKDFLILNLNRNQPRKRWDTCLKAFVRALSYMKPGETPVKLVIGTGLQGSWNLIEIYERELNKHNITLEVGKKHLMVIQSPQMLNDESINILYNACDVGINTCDGEGFGLCNFDHAGVGVPQIVPDLGGFKDFFVDGESAIMVEPVLSLYAENGNTSVGGETLLCSYKDFSDGIIDLYQNEDMRKKYGEKARSTIVENYKWNEIAQKLVNIVKEIHGEKAVTPLKEQSFTKQSLKGLLRNFDAL